MGNRNFLGFSWKFRFFLSHFAFRILAYRLSVFAVFWDFSKSIVESEIVEVEEFDAKIFQNLFNLGILGIVGNWPILIFNRYSEFMGFYFKLGIKRHVPHKLQLNNFLITCFSIRLRFCLFDLSENRQIGQIQPN